MTRSSTLASRAIGRVGGVGNKNLAVKINTISELVKIILLCDSDRWPQNSIKFERFTTKFSAADLLVGVEVAR